MRLDDSVQFVKGVGPRRAEMLSKLGLQTVADLLTCYPRTYADRTHVVSVMDLRVGVTATVRAQVRTVRPGRFRRVINVKFADDSGTIEAVWFNQPYLAGDKRTGRPAVFKKGDWFYLTGKVNAYHDRLQLSNPEFERTDPEDDDEIRSGILPVYGLTEGLTQQQLRRIMRCALAETDNELVEILPDDLLRSHGLPGIAAATRNIHFPQTWESRDAARRRLVYEEFFVLQTAMALRRASIERESTLYRVTVTSRIDAHIRRLFPFTLTGAQEKVIREITTDLARPNPMNRLLQGDVGSGKTVVAMYAMLAAVACGYQVALMAPTEVLAEQHYGTFGRFLSKARVRMERLIGGQGSQHRREILEHIAAGEVDIVFGTHALIEPEVTFAKLGLLVVDEQHKFGVVQRATLRGKGAAPHCLVMTATPIPRTLMLTVFGDLDVSVLDEMPPGRKTVVTKMVPPGRREAAFEFIRKEIARGRQAFFVYPRIDEGEADDVKSATVMARHLARDEFPGHRVGLLTGRMTSTEKDHVMDDFRQGRLDVLVATIVIEVGIDVPNATIMVIENAERFGLSQLHQLRGRIGRGEHPSFCLLFAKARTEDARDRLKVMSETYDGFRIAEEDLRLRGPGEFFGTRQHGLPEFRIANLIDDYDLLKLAATDARTEVAADPKLTLPRHTALRAAVHERFARRLELIDV